MGQWDDILNEIKGRGVEWWKEHVTEVSHIEGAEWMGKCPFTDHQDPTPSFNFNTTKAVYLCRGCGRKGTAVHLYATIKHLPLQAAVIDLRSLFGLAKKEELEISADIVEEYHRRLTGDDKIVDWMRKERGLSLETIQRYKIGYAEDRKRLSIPVYDAEGKCVNIRLYKPGNVEKNKVVSYRKGTGRVRFYPIEAIQKKEIVLCEGELDCLLLRQLKYNAVTAGGTSSWNGDLTKKVVGKKVTIAFDIDNAGVRGANKISSSIVAAGGVVRVVRLPLTEPENADVTDWFITHNKTKDEFDQLLTDTPWMRQEEPEGDYKEVSLFEASRQDYAGKKVRMQVMISGKDTTPWIIPAHVKITCNMDYGEKNCKRCPLLEAKGSAEVDFSKKDEALLEFVGVRANQINTIIRQAAGIPVRCNRHELNIDKRANLEEVRLVPEVIGGDIDQTDDAHVARQAFFRGHGIETNRGYVVSGRTIADPRNQYATHIIHEADLAMDSIDTFKITPELGKELEVFQVNSNTEAKEKLKEIYHDMEAVTGIYGRHDLFLAIDLVYHSVLGCRFQGRPLTRSWVQGLVIGDTRCGKTEAAKGFARHYRAGEIISGESVSFAGLVGGISKIGDRFNLQWGRIPLADRRLIILDEVSGMSVGDISSMSSVRSSGIAEVTKIQTEKTRARTRMLWLSNPRPLERTITSYTQGVLAVQELIGRPEDISRFDFIVSTASGEVPLEIINAPRPEETTPKYGPGICHALVMWAWSRKSADIVFEEGTMDMILAMANDQGGRYSASIPIVEPAEQKEKLARLAMAVAARFFSTDEEFKRLRVRPFHVELAYEFLEEAFSKPSLAYAEYSEIHKQKTEISNPAAIARYINTEVRDLMLSNDTMYATDIGDIVGIENREMLRKMLSTLVKNRCLRRNASGAYVKTEAFTQWIRNKQYEQYDSRSDDQDHIYTMG